MLASGSKLDHHPRGRDYRRWQPKSAPACAKRRMALHLVVAIAVGTAVQFGRSFASASRGALPRPIMLPGRPVRQETPRDTISSKTSGAGASAFGFPTLTFCAVAAVFLDRGVLRRKTGRSTAAQRSVVVRLVAEPRSSAISDIRHSGQPVDQAAAGVVPAANPATCWPAGRPFYEDDHFEPYDLTDPKSSFEKVGKRVLQGMVAELPDLYKMPEKEVEWVRRVLEYNAFGGKMVRGLIVVDTGVALMKSRGLQPTDQDLNRFAVLGWTVELLQSCMVMADDMMDGSLTRRGSPCWYRLPNVGMLNTNDFLMIEMLVYKVLKRHFGSEPYFLWLQDLYLETTFQTECGQLLDSICANLELKELTTDRWTLIVKYKTAFYSFYLPIALPMLVVGIQDPEAYDTARELLLLMGMYFQAQDDYLDAFANPDELGKVGTDIQDKKCSWLFAHAYNELSTPEGKDLLDKYYGKCKVGSKEEGLIKDLYRDLGLPDLFKQYEAEVTERLQAYQPKIEAAGLPWAVFQQFFERIHQRKK